MEERTCFNCLVFPNCKYLKELAELLSEQEKTIFMSLHGETCENYVNRL